MGKNINEQQCYGKLVDLLANPKGFSKHESIKIIKNAMPTMTLFGGLHDGLSCSENDLSKIARKIMILMS